MNIGDPKPQETTQEETPEQREKDFTAYEALIENYVRAANGLKKLSRRFAGVVDDPEVEASMLTFDRERHDIHLALLEVAKRLAKSEGDVLTDILRREGSLAEYGLPEFAILTSEDLSDWDFNISDDGIIKRPRKPEEVAMEEREEGGGAGWRRNSIPAKDEVLLVYAIGPERFDTRVNSGVALWPRDYDVRRERAEALATAIDSRVAQPRDGQFHQASMNVLGVIVKKSEIGEVSAIIRDANDTYRFGPLHYNKSDKEHIEKLHPEMVTEDISHLAYLCEEALDFNWPSPFTRTNRSAQKEAPNKLRETLFQDVFRKTGDYFELREKFFDEKPPSAKELKNLVLPILAERDRLPDRFLPEPTVPPPEPQKKVAEILPDALTHTPRAEQRAGGAWEQVDKRWWKCPNGHSVKGTKAGAPSTCDICEKTDDTTE